MTDGENYCTECQSKNVNGYGDFLKCLDCGNTMLSESGESEMMRYRNTKNLFKKDKTLYFRVHEWIKKHKRKPTRCEMCGKEKPLDYANLSQNYLFDINDWMCLCRLCHGIIDWKNSAYGRTMPDSNVTVVDFYSRNKELCISLLKRHARFEKSIKKRNITIFDRWTTGDSGLKEMGEQFGNISRERVRQIVVQCIHIIRGEYKPQKLVLR